MAQNSINRIVVFGGSAGVGLAVVKLALNHLPNAQVVITSSTQTKVDAAIQQLSLGKPSSSIIKGVVQDLSRYDTQYSDVESVLQMAVAALGGPIDHIVWTAGDSHPPPSGTQSAPSNAGLWERFTVRVFGPLTLESLARKYMAVSRHSSITLTTGVFASRPIPDTSVLAAVAGSVESASSAMAIDLAPIRINTVVLGAIRTANLASDIASDPALANVYKSKTLTDSVGEPEEAAEAYLYSMRCGFVAGARIPVDSGFLLK